MNKKSFIQALKRHYIEPFKHPPDCLPKWISCGYLMSLWFMLAGFASQTAFSFLQGLLPGAAVWMAIMLAVTEKKTKTSSVFLIYSGLSVLTLVITAAHIPLAGLIYSYDSPEELIWIINGLTAITATFTVLVPVSLLAALYERWIKKD